MEHTVSSGPTTFGPQAPKNRTVPLRLAVGRRARPSTATPEALP